MSAARGIEYQVVLGFESETDDIPVGALRRLWSPSSLERLDREVSTYEDDVGESVQQACVIMLSRVLSGTAG